MNDASRRRLDKVHPTLSAAIKVLIDALAQNGMQIEVVQGLRTFAEQDGLFAQGRSKPGPIVTRARGGQSNHNYGLAVDVVPFINGQPNWNAPLGVWTTIGSEAERLGLEWGGDWKKFVDKPHIQLPGMSVAECLSLYRRGGNKLDLVWAEASRRLLGVAAGVAGIVAGTSPAPSTPPGTSSSHPTLKLNDRGDVVRALQEALIGAGALVASTSGADGIFGPGTLAAVKKFQLSKGLKADGIVGAATWQVLLSAPSSMKGIPRTAKAIKKAAAKKAGPKKAGAKKGGAKKGTRKAAKKR